MRTRGYSATDGSKRQAARDTSGAPPDFRAAIQFLGEFAGVAQDEKTLTFRPESGWAVTEAHRRQSVGKVFADVSMSQIRSVPFENG